MIRGAVGNPDAGNTFGAAEPLVKFPWQQLGNAYRLLSLEL